jgi:hypothetical protein
MLVWSLADNPYRPFYEAQGGTLLDNRPITLGDQTLQETAYVWTSLRPLVEGC